MGHEVLCWFGIVLLVGVQGCGGSEAPPAEEEPKLNLEAAGKRILERKELPIGMPAPDFELVDQDGKTVTLGDLRGPVIGIGFIYTSCPDVCGLLAASFLDIEKQFVEAVDEGDLQLVLITTDPETDVPERLKKYTDGNGGKWRFLTGDMAACEEVWDAYGVQRTVNPSADYVYHTYKIVLIDGDGNMRYEFIGLDDPEADLVRDLTFLLGES